MITSSNARLYVGGVLIATVKECEIEHQDIRPLTTDVKAVRAACPEMSIRLDTGVGEQILDGLQDKVIEEYKAEGIRQANEKYRKIVEVAWATVQSHPVPADSAVEFLKETSAGTGWL